MVTVVVVRASAAVPTCRSEAADAPGEAVGDFNADNDDDLAVGRPDATLEAGAVDVTYGSDAVETQSWDQDSPDVLDVAEDGDRFGAAVAACDFNSDGFDDLAVGAPLEDLDSITNAGTVTVLYGSARGLSSAGNQVWSQDSDGIADAASPGDLFGNALAAADLNEDGYADLAVEAPWEQAGPDGVNLLYGGPDGLGTVGNRFLPGVGLDRVAEAVSEGDAKPTPSATSSASETPGDVSAPAKAAAAPSIEVGVASEGGNEVLAQVTSCANFPTREAAQQFHDESQSTEVKKALDPDGNLKACESHDFNASSAPGPPGAGAAATSSPTASGGPTAAGPTTVPLATSSAPTLSATGASIAAYALTGLVLLVLGLALIALTRRRALTSSIGVDEYALIGW